MIRYYLRLQFIFLGVIALLFLGCEEKKATDAKDFNKNLKSFNKSISQLDKTMDAIDAMDKEVEKVLELKNSGAISEQEAGRRLDILRNKYTKELSKISGNENTSMILPPWAVKLGLTLPENMTPDKSLSQTTSKDDPVSGYNSLTFIYKGDYKTAMQQAKRIAAIANIPEGKDYLDAQRMAKELDIEPLKGAIYMNYEIGKEDDKRYHIAITVDETGILTISATDMFQLKHQQDFNIN